MSKVLVFAGSNSSTSINKQLAQYAANCMNNTAFQVIDLNDFEVPIFSIDEENKNGYPEKAKELDLLIKDSKGIILSLAEHNGSYAAVFKNLFDWLSRITAKTWHNKPMLLMSTSPGGRGGHGVLSAAEDRFPRHDSKIIEIFSLPFFEKNFQNQLIQDLELDNELKKSVEKFESSL